MKIHLWSIFAPRGFWACLFFSSSCEAGVPAQAALKPVGESSASALSYELNGESSFFGRGGVSAGSTNFGNIVEISSSASFVLSTQFWATVLLRLGVEWQRYSFEAEAGGPVPD